MVHNAGPLNYGKQSFTWIMRNKLLSALQINPLHAIIPGEQVRRTIIITHKTDGNQVVRGISNFQQVADAVVQQFNSSHNVLIVQWQKLSMEEQLALLSTTDLLISPCGGVSYAAVFLPEHAHVILTDFYDVIAGVSLKMDGHVWNQVPYLNFHYIQQYYNETSPSFERYDYYRNQVGAIVDIPTLIRTISQALWQLSLDDKY